MNKLPLAKDKNIVVQDLDKEVLIYDLITHKALCLNETSAIVYQACDGKTSFDELKAKHKFTDDLIFLALDELKRENLLEESVEYKSPFTGISRREAIRKVGLASLIALPIVASFVAPTAASAQSCAGPGRQTSGQLIQSGGFTYCATDQANCNTVALNGTGSGGCCSGSATAVASPDCGGTDPFACRCN